MALTAGQVVAGVKQREGGAQQYRIIAEKTPF